MATNTIYTLEGVNLFAGDHDPTASNHLTIEDWTMPDLQAIYADHHPGGSFVAVEFEVGVQKITSTFKLKGFNPEVIKLFGIGTQLTNNFTGYGLVRDKRTGQAVQAMAVMTGRLGKITADQFKRGDSVGHSYSINEITHYEFYFNEAEMYYWDFWTNTYRIGGVDQNADLNQMLSIPSVQ